MLYEYPMRSFIYLQPFLSSVQVQNVSPFCSFLSIHPCPSSSHSPSTPAAHWAAETLCHRSDSLVYFSVFLFLSPCVSILLSPLSVLLSIYLSLYFSLVLPECILLWCVLRNQHINMHFLK